jgi:hypothetical protein
VGRVENREQRAQLPHVFPADRRGVQGPTGRKHAGHLGERPRQVRHVVEHVVGHDGVEGAVLEGYLSRVDDPEV